MFVFFQRLIGKRSKTCIYLESPDVKPYLGKIPILEYIHPMFLRLYGLMPTPTKPSFLYHSFFDRF